ncbi:MAG TPA: hypothetical protein PLP81_04715, partial [Saprospiraceae bacterium]|nr:hypothetical protein [Saprospiraceae bacterium]
NYMKRAMIYGSAMASLCVEEFSLQKIQTLTHDEIVDRLNEFVKLTKFNIKLNYDSNDDE